MIRVGITGQAGFVGTHLYNYLDTLSEEFERIPFEDSFFQDEAKLRAFVRQCDAIVHLAAMNRHPDPQVIYNTNIQLVKQLIAALEAEQVSPHILFSSSTQEERNNPYGDSKKEGRRLLREWAERCHGKFTGCIIPNVFGPFGRPNYNSVVATFCHRLTHGETPEICQPYPFGKKRRSLSDSVGSGKESLRTAGVFHAFQGTVFRERRISQTRNAL